jgi:hypothetical protein
MNDNTIDVRQTSRGAELHSFNHEKRRWLHVGTISGEVYEKGNISILNNPEPSICLMVAELQEAEKAGALFLRCILPDKSGTFAISLGDFRANAEAYYHAKYGRQLRVGLPKFQYIGAVVKRNARTDNPRKSKGELNIPQLDFFNHWKK